MKEITCKVKQTYDVRDLETGEIVNVLDCVLEQISGVKDTWIKCFRCEMGTLEVEFQSTCKYQGEKESGKKKRE